MPPPLDAPPAGTDLPLSTFVELDRNADGVVAHDELPASHSLTREFERFDADDDRRIDRDEFERYLAGGQDVSEDVDVDVDDDEDRR